MIPLSISPEFKAILPNLVVGCITANKEFYRVNTVVDINNLISLEMLHSAGCLCLPTGKAPSAAPPATRNARWSAWRQNGS